MSNRAGYMKEWRRKRKEQGIGVHSTERLVKQAAWLATTYRQLRSDLYAVVGRECVGCGLDDVRVLEFDHIHDDGADDRRKFGGARTMLEFYTKNPLEAQRCLQTLCRNCNWLKRKGFELPNAAGRVLDGRTHDGLPTPSRTNS